MPQDGGEAQTRLPELAYSYPPADAALGPVPS